MSLTDKEWKQIGKIGHKISKLYDKKEKEYEKAKQVLRNKIDKKYMDQIKELSELKNSLFREADKCKRCHGDGTITYRACAEADREEAECPDCKGTGKYQ
jgi:hypothetical protein